MKQAAVDDDLNHAQDKRGTQKKKKDANPTLIER